MPSHGIRHVVAKAKPKFRLVMLPEELMFKKFSWKKIQDFLRSLLLVSFVLFGCFFGLVCVFCLQRVAVCHIHSFGRPARRNPHLLTFRSISARWFSARVCSFGFYGFFPLCLAPENYIVIVTVALTGLPAV